MIGEFSKIYKTRTDLSGSSQLLNLSEIFISLSEDIKHKLIYFYMNCFIVSKSLIERN